MTNLAALKTNMRLLQLAIILSTNSSAMHGQQRLVQRSLTWRDLLSARIWQRACDLTVCYLKLSRKSIAILATLRFANSLPCSGNTFLRLARTELFNSHMVVVVVAFSSRAWILGEYSRIHSPPALFFLKTGD